MKKVPCSYKGCYQRRPHYTLQDEERGTQMVEVSDDHEGDAYCSLTCAMLDGKMSAKLSAEEAKELLEEGKNLQKAFDPRAKAMLDVDELMHKRLK